MAANTITATGYQALSKAFKKGNFLKEVLKVDPRDRYVVVFPDTHHVKVGIGFNLINNVASEKVFLKASEILNKNILRLCLEGPKEELEDSIVNRNIAAFVSSKAAIAKLIDEKPFLDKLIVNAAGVGVGLFNMLEFASSINFENALDLVKRRAEAIEKVHNIVPARKLLIKLRPATRIHKVCQAAIEHCIKNENLPKELAICSASSKSVTNSVVIGGHEKAIEYLENNGTRLFEFRDLKPINNEPACYHTELMQPAREYLSLYIQQRLTEDSEYIKEPSKSINSPITGKRIEPGHTDEIPRLIYDEVISTAKVEALFQRLYSRDKNMYQPNTIVVGDKMLRKHLSLINRKAYVSSEILEV